MKQYVSLADVVFEFDCPVEISAFKTMYSNFICENQAPDVRFQVVPCDTPPEELEGATPVENEGGICIYKTPTHTVRVQRISFHGGKYATAYLVRSNDDFDNYTLHIMREYMEQYTASLRFISIIALEEVLLHRGKITLHGVFLNDDGAYVFTAPSGTGKTTISTHWVNGYSTAQVINGDCTVLGLENGVVYAYSVPFCGSSRIRENKKAPIRSIVRVCRGEKNEAVPLTFAEKFRYLYEGVTVNRWDDDSIAKNADLVSEIISSCEMIAYKCINHPSAAVDLKEYFLLQNK